MKKNSPLRVLSCALVLAMQNAATAQSTAPATQPTTLPSHDAAFWDTLTRDMQLAAQAQRDLKNVTIADYDKLKQLANASTDPDIKSQLLARVADLDEQIVLSPRPISIDLKDATLSDVADALNKSLGVPIEPSRNRGNRPGTFTLSCADKPFWDVFTQLSEQHPLAFQTYQGLRLEETQPGLRRFFPASSGFAAFPLGITRSKSADGQKPDDKQAEPQQLILRYALGADPRMKIRKYMPAYLTEIKDDSGNDLLIAGTPQTNMWDSQENQIIFEQTAALAVPPALGKKIATAKGEARFLVQLATKIVEVDPKDSLNKPISLGDVSATISQFKVSGGSINFQVQTQGENGSNSPGVNMAFVDANDKVIWSSRLNGGSGGGVGGQFVEPVKIRFTVSTKTKIITIPFEMKDLPLP